MTPRRSLAELAAIDITVAHRCTRCRVIRAPSEFTERYRVTCGVCRRQSRRREERRNRQKTDRANRAQQTAQVSPPPNGNLHPTQPRETPYFTGFLPAPIASTTPFQQATQTRLVNAYYAPAQEVPQVAAYPQALNADANSPHQTALLAKSHHAPVQDLANYYQSAPAYGVFYYPAYIPAIDSSPRPAPYPLPDNSNDNGNNGNIDPRLL